MPIDGIVGVLEEVWAFFVDEAVGFLMFFPGGRVLLGWGVSGKVFRGERIWAICVIHVYTDSYY